MDPINRSAAVIFAALALGLTLPTGAIELTQRRIDDGMTMALLQNAMHHIKHGTDRTSVHSARPLRPENLLRKLDWLYDTGEWYGHQQERGKLYGGGRVLRIDDDKYGYDDRLVRTANKTRLLNMARGLGGPDFHFDHTFKENNGRRLLAGHREREAALESIWRAAECPAPQTWITADAKGPKRVANREPLPQTETIWVFPDHAVRYEGAERRWEHIQHGEQAGQSVTYKPEVVNRPGLQSYIDCLGANANRERLVLLRAKEAREEIVGEPSKPAQWKSKLEEGGFKAGPPRVKKKRSRFVSRAVLWLKKRVVWNFKKKRWVREHTPRYTVGRPTLAPAQTRYVPCMYITLMDGVLKTNEDGDEITIEDVGMDGDRVIYG
jgi:hypothetical protein